MPVGRSVSRRRATTRSHPLADPLLPSGGPIRPASYGRLSCACGAIRFCSARRTAPPLALFAVAQPILSAMFGSQCAALAIRSLPLARSMAPAPRAPWWALPPRPEAPPVPQPKGNRAEAVSAAGPSLAGPTPASSLDGRTSWSGPAALPARLGSSSRRSASRRTPRASFDPRRAATNRAGSLRFLQSVRSSRWPPVFVYPLKRRMAGLRGVADREDGPERLHPRGLLHSVRALPAFIAKARSSLPQDGPLALRKRNSAGRGLHLPSGNARLGNPDRQAPTSHNRAIIQRRG